MAQLVWWRGVMVAAAALMVAGSAWAQEPASAGASSCDGGFKAPPFFDVTVTPELATVKKRFQAGNMIFDKGISVVVLDRQGDTACVLMPGMDGPVQGRLKASLLTMVARTITADDWRGHWQGAGQVQPDPADPFLPEWAQGMAAPAPGSTGDIFVYGAGDFAAAQAAPASPVEAGIFAARPYAAAGYAVTAQTVGMAGRKAFTGKGGVEKNDNWVGLVEAHGPLLVYDSGGLAADRCWIVLLYLPNDRVWVNSYGLCGGGRVHDDGYYQRVP